MAWAIFAYQFIVVKRILKIYSENMHSDFHYLNKIVDFILNFKFVYLNIDVSVNH